MIKKSRFYLKKYKGGLIDLNQRIIFIIIAIIILRIGSFIPIPGVNINLINHLINKQHNNIIEIFNIFSGGALSRASIFSLGIMPYISSSIIIQLITVISSKLSEIKKQGDIGKFKINKYIKYCTLIISILQSITVVLGLPNIFGINNLIINSNFITYFASITSLVCGTLFLMWLGEQITKKGIGNGISIIIFIGIISGLPKTIYNIFNQTWFGDIKLSILMCVLILLIIITFFVVFIESGQRRILVHYAQRQKGRRIYTTQKNHLPLKVNMAGVIPAIFASSIILFLSIIISWFGSITNCYFLSKIAFYIQPKKPIYILLYVTTVIFFCFFYTALTLNSRETADNLKKSGAFLLGIRPGEQTAKFINKIMLRLTFIGSIYISFICIIPDFIHNIMNMPFSFGGTSLLIVVVVIIDFITQLQTIMISNQYKSKIKKINFKNFYH